MRRSKWMVLSAALGALVWAVPMTATAKSPEVRQPAAQMAKAARGAWPPETISGSIMSVVASKDLLIMKGPSGVPFDMKVSRGTRILSGSQTLTLASLSPDVNREVSVRFTPERSGDVARVIRIQQ